VLSGSRSSAQIGLCGAKRNGCRQLFFTAAKGARIAPVTLPANGVAMRRILRSCGRRKKNTCFPHRIEKRSAAT
jgi:hypothetical protein